MITTFTCKKRNSSKVWDIRELAYNVKWETTTNFAAGTLTFNLLEVQEGFVIRNGDVICLKWNKKKIFYGYVFKYEYSSDETFSVTAYDALRYFKNQDSLVMPISTVSQRFEKVAKMAGVKFKTVATSSEKLKAEVCDNKSYFDMLSGAIAKTKRATNKHFYLYANYNVVELRKFPYKQLKLVIGDKSLMESFNLSRSIENTANVVRIIKDSKKKKGRSSATAQSSPSSIKKLGRLTYIEKAKEKANPAQIKARAKQLLKQKSKEENTLKVTAVGHTDLVAGNACIIKSQSLKEVGLGTKSLLITKSTHHFNDRDYTVDLELNV
ncbi:hypothetical protein FD06_GL000278 [Apilactobacillus ozensis DSM 23829 = JCM 17196]|uniref:YqbQ/XkdQ domain-containing protein n=1 Tax=Apilactobacillus ozensis DSM 23829 = JCM 17196 TaxID=1423781 RepID=A0A0R2B1G9_9LACO|nr:hypothetical protein [Apilactobacillus ozensis]KRM69219.1 hypothetical protein FD06_GL000278 [Apilactobacillus ozensis DSM 23829 = JCM 17196]